MLTTDRVALPAHIEVRLKRASDFVDNVMDFARDDLIGFRRPLAATFAFSAPLVLAIVFHEAGLVLTLKIGALYAALSAAGLVLVGREVWPEIVEDYRARSDAKRKALADLRCGFGESAFLHLPQPPRFIEHDHGVIALADAGDFRTLFFSITNDEDDPRWPAYVEGEMNRRIWRWLRLPVSGEIVRFAAEGGRMDVAAPLVIESVDAWEAVNVALGEPADGAIVHTPFSEVVDMVERLV